VPNHSWKVGALYRSAVSRGRLTLSGDVYITSGNPYCMVTPLYERDMPTFVRYDVKATYDLGKFQGALFATLQPHEFASDIACGTAGALLVVPLPQATAEATLRCFF
jgi:hypothetical protein